MTPAPTPAPPAADPVSTRRSAPSGALHLARPAVLLALAASLVLADAAASQTADAAPPATSSDGATTTVLLENDRVLVVENRYKPGAEGPLHAHAWPRTVYVVEGGVLEMVDADGTARRVEVAAGTALWRPAERHRIRNPGTTRVVVVETEIKPGSEQP